MVETHEIPGVSRGRRLAVGGMGELFLGQRATPGGPEPCVIKELLPRAGDLERDLFAREAEALAALARAGSQRVVRLLGAGPEASRPAWLLLEWVDGVDLLTLLEHRRRRGRPLPLGAAHAVVLALAEALVELGAARGSDDHLLGLVHRDIHPGNVLLGRDGAVKLADLGVATFSARGATDADLKGTLAFMAPEQLRAGHVSPASDLYAAALVAYEALTGVPARPTGSGVGLGELLAARATLPTAPSQHRPELAGPLEAALLAALAVDPSARPSPSAWLDALRPTLAPDPAALAALVATAADSGTAVRAAPTLGRAPTAPAPVSTPVAPALPAPAPTPVAPTAPAPAPTPAAPAAPFVPATPTSTRPRKWRLAARLGLASALGAGALAWGLGQADPSPRIARDPETEPRLSPDAGPTPSPDALGPAPDTRASDTDTLRPTLDPRDADADTRSPALSASDTASATPPAPDAIVPDPDANTRDPDANTPDPDTRSPDPDTRPAPDPDTRTLAPRDTASIPPDLPDAGPPDARTSDARPHAPAPSDLAGKVLVRAVDGPVHVAGPDDAGLAPRATPTFGPDEVVVLRLTGGARPMKATVRLTRQGGRVLATVGAPRDTVLQVTCGGAPERPTPVAGLLIGPEGLTCRLRSDDGRTMAFALVDERR